MSSERNHDQQLSSHHAPSPLCLAQQSALICNDLLLSTCDNTAPKPDVLLTSVSKMNLWLKSG